MFRDLGAEHDSSDAGARNIRWFHALPRVYPPRVDMRGTMVHRFNSSVDDMAEDLGHGLLPVASVILANLSNQIFLLFCWEDSRSSTGAMRRSLLDILFMLLSYDNFAHVEKPADHSTEDGRLVLGVQDVTHIGTLFPEIHCRCKLRTWLREYSDVLRIDEWPRSPSDGEGARSRRCYNAVCKQLSFLRFTLSS
jgi:hypothetical protein